MNSTLSPTTPDMAVKPIGSASEYDEAFNEYMGMELNTPQESTARKRLQDYRLKSGMTPGDFGQFTNTKKVNALDTMMQGEFRELGQDEIKGINEALGLNAYDVFKRADEKGKATMYSVSYADAAIGGNARGNLAQLGYMLKAKDFENTEEVYGILKERVRQAHEEHTKKWDALKGPMEADYQNMVRAVSQGEVFQSNIPEMAQVNKSAKKAGEFMKKMAYGDDRVSPQAQGMHTGVGGLVDYGYSPSRVGGWVEEFVLLKNDDPDAYGLAMEALQSLTVAHTSKDLTFAEKFSRTFLEAAVVGPARFGDDLINDARESLGIGMEDKHKEIPNWKQLSNDVVNDLANVRQGSFKSDKGGFKGWIDDFGNMAGGSSAFIFRGGVPAMFSLAQNSKESYAGMNSADSLARWKGVFEGGAILAVNRLGVNTAGKVLGKRYDVWMHQIAKKLGNNRALGRVLASDRWMIRFPTHMAMSQVGEFSQEVVEPFAQYFAGNAISLGGGMEWSDALEQARAVFEPSNVGHMITYGFLIGGAGHVQNVNSRGEFLKTVQNRRIMLDTANSPKQLRDIGLSEEKVQAIINERMPDDQIKLLQYAVKDHMIEQSIGGEDVAIVLPPESDYVQDAMRDKRMPEYRRLQDGRFERIALDGESEFIDAESATKLMQTEASELIKNDMKLFREADIDNDLIDYFVKNDASLEFVKLNKKLDLQAVEELRDAIFKGDYAVFDEHDSSGKLKEFAQTEEGKSHFAILPKSLRARAEYEASVTGKASTGNEHAVAFNIRTSTARKLVGFYNNDLTAYNLVEERAELYVKQELVNGRELGWIGENLILTQRELKAQKVKGWQLVPEGKKVEELSEMEVIEGVSRLSKAIFAQEYRTRQLPEMVQRFLDIISALCNEVKDWIRLASVYKKAVSEGKIDEDFASFIYQSSEGLIDHQAKQAEANIETKVGKKRKRYHLTKKVAERVDFAISQGDLDEWRKQFDSYVDGSWNSFKPLSLGNTPDVLRAIGIENRPIVISPKVIKKITLDKHDLSEDNVRALAEALHDPILIMESWTKENSFVVMTSVRSSKGNVMVALTLDKNMSIGVVHNIASAYSKDNALLEVMNQLQKGNCLYMHKKKALSWARSNRLSLPKVASQKGKAKILEPEDVIKWKLEQYDKEINFALDSGVRMSLEEMASRAHVSAVRDYFSSVLEKTDSELANLRRLFEGKVDDKAMKVLEARAAFRLALNALPKSAREQVKNYEDVVDHVLNAYAKGQLNVDEVLSEELVRRVSRLFGLQEGVFMEFAGKKLEDAIITMYERCNTVMNRHARDEMHEVAMKMIKASSPVLDESTKKYKVGIIGARAQEFLQETLKPIFESTQATCATKIAEIKAQMSALEEGKGLNDVEGASIETLQQEYVLWEAYGACKSLSAERMLGALEYLENFLDQSKNAWLMEQSERVDKWNAERDEAKSHFKHKQTEMKRKKAMAEYNNTNEHGLTRKLSSAIAEAVENPIKALERYGEKSGAGKFFRALAEESVRVQNEIHYDQERDAREFREKLMKLTGSKNEVEFNAWYDWVNKPIKLDGKTAPFGTRRRNLTLEHAAEIYARRKKDPWFGYATYSQQSIDSLMEAYERWLSGEDKSTKWLHVEEFVKLQGEELELTPGEMMHILMTSERYFARRIYAKKGYEPLYAEMRKHIGPQGEAVIEMMFEMYAKLGDRVRPLYEARYGVPFSKNRRYAPLRWITVDNLKDVDLAQLLQTTGDVAVGRVDGFLSATEMHNRDVDLTTSALNLFWQHHSAVNNWVHTQELVRKYRYMLSNASFAQDMLVNLGGTDYKLFNNYLNNLEKGGIAKAQAQGDLMKMFANGVNTMSISVLAGQISSLVKQAGNIFNALYGSDIGLIDWVKGLARVLSGKSLYSVKEFYDSDLFDPRKNAFANSVLMGYKRQLGGKFGWVEKMSEVPMSWLGKADTYTNAVSFVALFEHHYRNFAKLGMSKEAAHEAAVKEVELGLSRIAAPVDFTQKAKVLSDDNSVANQAMFWLKVESLGKLASVTRHISRANELRKDGDYAAMLKHTRLAVRSWMLQGASMQALGYLVGLAMGDPDDEDRLNPINFVPGILMGPLNGLPIIGDLFSKPIGWLVEEPFNSLSEKMGFDYRFKDYGGGMNQFIFNWKDVMQMVDYFKGDKDFDELKDMGELSRKGSKATGLFAVLSSFGSGRKKMIMTSSALAITAVLNMSKYFAGIADNIDHALSD